MNTRLPPEVPLAARSIFLWKAAILGFGSPLRNHSGAEDLHALCIGLSLRAAFFIGFLQMQQSQVAAGFTPRFLRFAAPDGV
jgi:hypothetical protein